MTNVNLKELIKFLESKLNLPENHRLIAVFQDNDHDEIVGWVVAENGKEGDCPVLSTEELLEKYSL